MANRKNSELDDMNEFFEQNKIFSTSQARRAGITKKFIRDCNDIVELGSFPVRTDQKGHQVRRENLYTYNPELAKLAKRVNKLSKKPNTSQEELLELKEAVETKFRELLWNQGENDDQEENTDG